MDRCSWTNYIHITDYKSAAGLLEQFEEYTSGDHLFVLVFDTTTDEAKEQATYLWSDLSKRPVLNVHMGSPIFSNRSFLDSVGENLQDWYQRGWFMAWPANIWPGLNWDNELWRAVKHRGDRYIYTPNVITEGYGASPSDFEFEWFDDLYSEIEKEYSIGSIVVPAQSYTPFLMTHKQVKDIGGIPSSIYYPTLQEQRIFNKLERQGIDGVYVPRSICYKFGDNDAG